MINEKKEVKTPQKLGKILVHYKIITPEQLEEVLKIQKVLKKIGIFKKIGNKAEVFYGNKRIISYGQRERCF